MTAEPNMIKGNGFTLIELMIMVVIVSVLAGFLVPALQKSRSAGQRAVCANNLRQVGMAIHMYIEEHNDIFPNFGNISGPIVPWYVTINNYLKSSDIYYCPEQKNVKYNWIPNQSSSWNLSFAYNMAISDKSLKDIKKKSETIFLSDSTRHATMFATYPNLSLSNNPAYVSIGRHGGGDNCYFVDGHCRWYLASEIFGTNGTGIHGPAGSDNWWDLN